MISFEKAREILDLRGFDEGHKRVTVDREGLMELLRNFLSFMDFDEEKYMSRNLDVKSAIKNGECKSAFEHYVKFGYFEGRNPCLKNFKFKSYLEQNTDVADGVKDDGNAEKIAREHFENYGFYEGRNCKL